MNTNKRIIEVFTAGCPVCRETLELVQKTVSSRGCEVTEQRCEGETCCAPARSYGIKALPSIVVDGKIVFEGRPALEQARELLAT